MDLAATLFSTGWASGVNAYATVALLSLLGRAGVGEVPDAVESDPVLIGSVAMFAVEFVTDKIPWLDSVWDSIHTFIRPAIAIVLGFQYGGEAGVSGLEEALGAGGSGATALASHAVKAGIRLGINTSPEPATNILASLTEDGLVAVVVLFSINNPEIAAAIAFLLLAAGLTLIAFLWKRIRVALRRRRERRSGASPRAPPAGQVSARSRAPWRRPLVLGLVLTLAAVGFAAFRLAEDPAPAADERGSQVSEIEIDSEAVDGSQPVSIVVPAGSEGEQRPLLVFLHGRGNDEDSNLVDAMYAGLAKLGAEAPVVVFPDGGDSSYWHDRADGEWGRYVTDEVIPEAIEASGADPSRVAIGGISMGGFGAFDIARLNPGLFCAVGGHSPAIWATAGDSAAGAFDDAEDFAAHDLVASAGSEPGGLAGPRLWLDRGDADPFVAGDDAFVSALGSSGIAIESHASAGGHDGDYWNAHWDEYLRFYGEALADC